MRRLFVPVVPMFRLGGVFSSTWRLIVPPRVPRRRYGVLRWIGRSWLGLAGWRVEGELPDVGRCVAAVAPHSSNWDFVHAVAVVFALDLRVSFIGKHSLFRGPLGRFMRWLGGLPVDRSRPNGLVDDMVSAFARHDALWLGIAPEGTRSRVDGFKSGFYRIALGAGVPILPAALNYRERALILLPPIVPHADVERGVAELEALFDEHGARRR
jgi:1-acyl-sn-glycerol-3-phosphate acyltransferase